ncbi:MAG: XRE family transcriptional regulator [Firmicutes bacterium HGW-Firmicutes-12]|jgi:putative transcriptional regulator|nr:MAG: XRE family transcriptional regulator [Firmicutes bacterium HGW-Firmicutes-12]
MSLKEYRNRKGYTQEQVARNLDITLRHYQYIEHEKVTPNVLIGLKLAQLLEVDPFILYRIDPSETKIKPS